MNFTLQLGPMVLAGEVLTQIVAVAIGMILATYLGSKITPQLEKLIWKTVIIGFISSRLMFVARYNAAYLADPLEILDIRDGGWNAPFGYFAAWAYGVWKIKTEPKMRRAVLSGLTAATFIWILSLVLTSLGDSEAVRLKSAPLYSLDGDKTALEAFQGKPTVINLWATWCPPCRREMPAFEQAQKNFPQINFVFLNQGESAEQVQTYLQDHQLELHNVLLDSKGEAGSQFSRSMLPTTIFFDAKGRLVDIRLGELSYPSLLQRLERLELEEFF